NDNTVRVWALASAEADSDPYRTLRGHGGWVRFAAFSSDGTSIVSAGYDQQVKWWRVDDYAEYLTLDDHEDAVLDATYSPDGTRVMTVGRDERAIVWDARTGDLLQVLEEGHDFLASSVAFFPPGVPRV